MKIFLSWSGQKSRDVALALREWLPGVINEVEPFVSAKDIYAGTRWQAEIAAQLSTTNYGLICVTKENQQSTWLNFEAGALAKAVDSSRVIPLAIDLKPSDVQLPLGQFQGQEISEPGMLEVMSALNSSSASPLSDGLLSRSVKTWWPDLHERIEKISATYSPSMDGNIQPERSERELLEETLNTVRSLARQPRMSLAQRDRPTPIDRDHPAVAEISELLEVSNEKILTATSHRGIGVKAGRDLPEELRDEIKRICALYDIRPSFLGRSSRVAAIAESEDDASQTTL